MPTWTAHILRLRSGMLDGKKHELSEVGEELGISRERVRILQHDGLRVIQHLRESQRHLCEEPLIPRYRFRLPKSVAWDRWTEELK